MKKIIPYILIVVTILQLFAPFSVGVSDRNNIVVNKNEVEAAGGCTITKVQFTPQTTFADTTPITPVSLDISTTGCQGQLLSGTIEEPRNAGTPNLSISPQKITSDNFSISIQPGERGCFNGGLTGNVSSACKSQLTLQITDATTNSNLYTYTSQATGGNGGADVLYFTCKTIINNRSHL